MKSRTDSKISGYCKWLCHFLLTICVLAGCAAGVTPRQAATPASLAGATATTLPSLTPSPVPATPTVPTTLTALPTTTVLPSPTAESSATATAAATEIPTATTLPSPTGEPPIVSITDAPIFVGGNVQLVDWSPDGRYLAYFEYTEEELAQVPWEGAAEGTFTFYDTATGAKCQRYSVSGAYDPHAGPLPRHTWLPDGDLFISTQDGQLLRSDAPCGNEEVLNDIFPEAILRIENASPDGSTLVLAGATAYWLYEHETDRVWPIADVKPASFWTVDNLVWSPSGTAIGLISYGDDTGDGAAVGSVRIVDAATGQVIAQHDMEPFGPLLGPAGPVWLNDEELVVTHSEDQGPFFMTVAGQVRPLLPLFGLEFVQGNQTGVGVYVEPDSGVYHILWDDELLADQPQIYHSDTGSVEILEELSSNATIHISAYFRPDGKIIVYRYDTNSESRSYLSRPITAVDQPLQPTPDCSGRWFSRTPSSSYVVVRGDHTADIYTYPDCVLQARVQVEAYRNLRLSNHLLSPNGQWLALAPQEESGRQLALALFVVSVEKVLAAGR